MLIALVVLAVMLLALALYWAVTRSYRALRRRRATPVDRILMETEDELADFDRALRERRGVRK